MLEEKDGFRKRLADRQKKIQSLVCVGLDPLPSKMPECLKENNGNEADIIADWMIRIVNATTRYTAMYKLQRAHWEAIPGGEEALRRVIEYIRTKYPLVLIFTDCKRGDIQRTQARYREAIFNLDKTQGANFSPYMGKDCMEFLVDPEHKYRAIVGLCYTSNPKAREVQDVKLENGLMYWEFIAQKTLEWSQQLDITENAGLVMAAAYENPKGSGNVFSEHLSRGRKIVGDKLWYLIPGVGTQGGFVEQTVKDGWAGYGSMVINSSSGIIFASQGNDFDEAAGKEAEKLQKAIYEAMKKYDYC